MELCTVCWDKMEHSRSGSGGGRSEFLLISKTGFVSLENFRAAAILKTSDSGARHGCAYSSTIPRGEC